MGTKSEKPKITYLTGRYTGIFQSEGRRGVQFGIDFHDGSGHRRRRIVGPNLKTALKELMASRGRAVEGRSPGIYTVDRRLTFARFVRERYESEVLAAIEDDRTHAARVVSLKPLLVFFGFMPLVKIDEAAVERYKFLRRKNQIPIPAEETVLIRRREDGTEIRRKGFVPRKAAIAANTISRELVTLGVVLRYAVKVKALPQELLPRITRPPKEHREVYHGATEMIRLLEKANPRIVPIVKLALATGRRQMELLTLAPKDVDWERRVIRFQRVKSHRKTILVPMNLTAEQVLKKLSRPLSDDAPYFSIKRRHLQDLFSRAVRLARLGDFRFHDLRHVVGSHLLNKGVPDQMRAEVLGHSVGFSGTLAQTQAYSHATLDYLRKVYEELDDLCGTQPQRSALGRTMAEVGEKRSKGLILGGQKKETTDAMDLGGLDRLFQAQGRKDGRETLGKHGFP